MLDGAIGIRKIEFDKPWLRVVREKNGAWNLTGILGAVDLILANGHPDEHQ